MKKNITLMLIIILATTVIALFASPISKYKKNNYFQSSYFSQEANLIFTSSVTKDVDLNSGITMERAIPGDPDQINYVTFAVFNHTDEPIVFSNQGFGLSVYRFDEVKKNWEKLQLPHEPYREQTILPPKIDSWMSGDGNTWDILEDDTLAFGYKKLRLYTLGRGKYTNTPYGAYLDVIVSEAR